jgi:hypothetical protein
MLGAVQGSTLQSLVVLFIHKYVDKECQEIQLHFTGFFVALCAGYLPPIHGSNSLIIHSVGPTLYCQASELVSNATIHWEAPLLATQYCVWSLFLRP